GRDVGERAPALGADGASRLITLYGGDAQRILARIDADATAARPLPGQRHVVRAEIDHVLDEEMALTLEDVLERRTRLLLFDPGQGLECAEAVAAIAAERLGWDASRTAAELAGYRALAASLRRFP